MRAAARSVEPCTPPHGRADARPSPFINGVCAHRRTDRCKSVRLELRQKGSSWSDVSRSPHSVGMSHGHDVESNHLHKNLEDHFEYLVQQLRDLENCRDKLGDDYETARRDALEQLEVFDCSLRCFATGDATLETELTAAIQAAVNEAFHTPEVINLFAKQHPRNLRAQLARLDQDAKVGAPETVRQKAEILAALRSFDETI